MGLGLHVEVTGYDPISMIINKKILSSPLKMPKKYIYMRWKIHGVSLQALFDINVSLETKNTGDFHKLYKTKRLLVNKYKPLFGSKVAITRFTSLLSFQDIGMFQRKTWPASIRTPVFLKLRLCFSRILSQVPFVPERQFRQKTFLWVDGSKVIGSVGYFTPVYTIYR